MAVNQITVVTGINDTPAAAAAALETALELVDTAKIVFLCEIYRQGTKWYHVLIHNTN
jgi:hypothetical protein